MRALPPPRISYSESALRSVLESPRRDEIISQARTVLCHGLPIAAWGIWQLWDGVYSTWAWFTAPCSAHAVGLVRLAKASVREAQQTYFAKRIQAEVSCDLPGGIRLAELVGFCVEGKLRSFGLGGRGDFWMLSIIG